jgi:hypothetical protein
MQPRHVSLLVLFVVATGALSGCGLGIRSYFCEDQVNRASANTSTTSYNSGRRDGIRAALDCFASRSGRVEQAVEACTRALR